MMTTASLSVRLSRLPDAIIPSFCPFVPANLRAYITVHKQKREPNLIAAEHFNCKTNAGAMITISNFPRGKICVLVFYTCTGTNDNDDERIQLHT